MLYLNGALSIVASLPTIAILIICLMYLAKNKSTDAWLLTLGSVGSTLIMIIYRASFLIGDASQNVEFFQKYSAIISLAGIACSILYCVGLFLLIRARLELSSK